MQIGLLTDSLSTMTRGQALDTAAELGIETVEIGLGGWSPAPHADLAALLADAGARAALQRDISSRGLRLEAFNAAGNPLHPVDGSRHDHVLRSALQLAEEFHVDTVVTMSGLPAAAGDRFPAWITTVWPPENLQLLDHQWRVAIDYWVVSPPRHSGEVYGWRSRCTPTSSCTTCRACCGCARPSATRSEGTSTPATCYGWVQTR
jgi:sugar phosphate isomerase/epimerase